MRDSQRQRIYNAEWSCEALTKQPSFDDIQVAQAFVRELLEDERVVVRRKASGHSGAFARAREIAMPASGPLKTWILVHEAAHVATPSVFPGHGREYATKYLELVEDVFGADVQRALRRAFDDHGVTHGPRDENEFAQKTRRAIRWHRKHETDTYAVIVLKSGRTIYSHTRPNLVGDRAVQTSTAHASGLPEIIDFDDIAYISYRKALM